MIQFFYKISKFPFIMLVFIDDSGDPGFKVERGSTEFFVIAAVLFYDPLEVEKTALAIKELRRHLGFPDSVEFKFNKSRKEVREIFLQTVNPFNFKIRSIVVEKKIVPSEELRKNKKSFYSFMIKMLLQHSNREILNAKIKLDGGGDREFKKNFLSYLRREVNEDHYILQNCKLVDSKQNVLIQMADMIAGTIRRSYNQEKTDKDLYKNIIKSHISNEWRFQ